MKKIICTTLLIISGVIWSSGLHAEISLPYFGNNNFDLMANTFFAADLNNGSSGLSTEVGVGLWFELVPYQDRNITPQRNILSVSLKLANSAVYAWRGYDIWSFMESGDGGYYVPKPNDVMVDQATSIWFDTFIAQLEYNEFWIRVAGIEPEVTISQASIKSVFDPLINNRTAIDKNEMYLPLFSTGGHYNPHNVGVVSVINRDLVNLNRREVEIAGNLSAGMKTENFDLTLKAGSWKTAVQNENNSWIAGLDFTLRPDFSNLITFSFLGAANYDTVRVLKKDDDSDIADPMPDPEKLAQQPLAFGIGYEYRLELGGRNVIKPYVGFDFIYEAANNEFDWEIGGGLQWFFRGTGAQFKRNNKIGGANLGDVNIPAALIIGMNVDKSGILNAIASFNEDPRSSPIRNFGGFFNFEFMNITGKDFNSLYYTGNGFEVMSYNSFMWATVLQLEYLLHDNIMPYVFAKYMPAIMPADRRASSPIFHTDYNTITSKAGCRFTPFKFFVIDLWYERNDFFYKGEWELDNGILSVMFGIGLFY